MSSSNNGNTSFRFGMDHTTNSMVQQQQSSSSEVGGGVGVGAGYRFRSTTECQLRPGMSHTRSSIMKASNTIIHSIQEQKNNKHDSDEIIKNNKKGELGNTTTTTIGYVSDLSEARYWFDSFQLSGGSNSTYHPTSTSTSKQYAHCRTIEIQAASAAIVHQIQFHIRDEHLRNQSSSKAPSSNHTTLAVVSGPRVQLYGTAGDSTYQRALSLRFGTSQQQEQQEQDRTIRTSDRQIPTGGQLALCCHFRHDQRLVAIGTATGHIRISDCSSTSRGVTLCQFHCYVPLPIRSVQWFRNGAYVLSAGDDAVLRVWRLKQMDASSSSSVRTNGATTTKNDSHLVLSCPGHGDSIRCAVLWEMTQKMKKNNIIVSSTSTASPTVVYPYTALAATGSYDHTVRLWNMEQLVDDADEDTTVTNQLDNNENRCVSILQHGAPVEALQFITSTSMEQPSSANISSTGTKTIPPPPVWLVSGGGTIIKVWNPMNGTCISTIQTQHRKTITCLLVMPRIYLSPKSRGGSNDHHDQDSQTNQGAITDDKFFTKEYATRLLTGGLDGLIRIHSFDRGTGTVRHLHGVRINKYDNQGTTDSGPKKNILGITALAVTPMGDRFAIGTTAGTVLIRQKGYSIVPSKRSREPMAGTYAFYQRGMNYNPQFGSTNQGGSTTTGSDQIIIDSYQTGGHGASSNITLGKKRKLTRYDLALKQFRYGDALDEVIGITHASTNSSSSTMTSPPRREPPHVIVNVFEELGRRRGLRIALMNRDEENLEPILSFLTRYITNQPQYSEVLIGIANLLIDIYYNPNNNNNNNNNSSNYSRNNNKSQNNSSVITNVSSDDDDNNSNDDDEHLDVHKRQSRPKFQRVRDQPLLMGQSDLIDELFNKLRRQILIECRLQKNIFHLLGQMDALATTAEMMETNL